MNYGLWDWHGLARHLTRFGCFDTQNQLWSLGINRCVLAVCSPRMWPPAAKLSSGATENGFWWILMDVIVAGCCRWISLWIHLHQILQWYQAYLGVDLPWELGTPQFQSLDQGAVSSEFSRWGPWTRPQLQSCCLWKSISLQYNNVQSNIINRNRKHIHSHFKVAQNSFKASPVVACQDGFTFQILTPSPEPLSLPLSCRPWSLKASQNISELVGILWIYNDFYGFVAWQRWKLTAVRSTLFANSEVGLEWTHILSSQVFAPREEPNTVGIHRRSDLYEDCTSADDIFFEHLWIFTYFEMPSIRKMKSTTWRDASFPAPEVDAELVDCMRFKIIGLLVKSAGRLAETMPWP